MVNAIVWADNIDDSAPVWCDISSRLVVGLSVGLTASGLCIQRRLYRIATAKQISDPCDSGKRELIIELTLGLGLPVLVVMLYYVVQVARYVIIEDIGCWPVTMYTALKIPTILMWPVIITFSSFVYAGLTIHALTQRRRQFSRVLSGSGTDLTMSRFFRLMALAATEMLFAFPISIYFLIKNVDQGPFDPWISWKDTHEGISKPRFSPRELMLSEPDMMRAFSLNQWAVPGCAFLFFMYFGLSSEAVQTYKGVLWKVVTPLGLKRSVSKSRGKTSTRTKKLVGNTTTSGSDEITIPSSVHTAFDSSHTSLDQVFDFDDMLRSGVQLKPIQTAIQDLESRC
ncbi:a-factor receptor [Ceratobasidium sp. 428]|nr:a-factor receptor [Ceratobasidium sp. 428]